ncbi:MAG: hypothetical protein U1F57_09150 [bacterium]
MNKGIRSLKKLGRILKMKGPNSQREVPLAENEMSPLSTSLERLLLRHLPALDSGMEILDRQFPVLEGVGRVDYIAVNSRGELILVWALEKLKPDGIHPLIQQYDWCRKNLALWRHLFTQVKKGNGEVKVWWVVGEVDPQIQSILPYVNGISLEIFRYVFIKKGTDLSLKPYEDFKSVPVSQSETPPPAFSLHPAPVHSAPVLPSLTQEEVRDFMKDEGGDPSDEEDEITDPFIHLSDLSKP